jgi:hypothetical protein
VDKLLSGLFWFIRQLLSIIHLRAAIVISTLLRTDSAVAIELRKSHKILAILSRYFDYNARLFHNIR